MVRISATVSISKLHPEKLQALALARFCTVAADLDVNKIKSVMRTTGGPRAARLLVNFVLVQVGIAQLNNT